MGVNVGEAAGQTVMHLHVHVIPRFRGDVDDPRGGVRFVIPSEGNYERPGHIPRLPRRGAPLATGGREDPFLPHLLPLLRGASNIAILVAFAQGSGVDRLQGEIVAALRRGARVRVLTGDYLNLTQARALRSLLDLARGREAEIAEPDCLPLPVAHRREAETAFVLARSGKGDPWRYLGVGRWREEEGAWAIPEVDPEIWRELGHDRTASRPVDET